jgi:hypothetical protein
VDLTHPISHQLRRSTRLVNTNQILEIWVNGVLKANWSPVTVSHNWQWYTSPVIFLQSGSNQVIVKNRGSNSLGSDTFYIDWSN